jgi:RimJ/RimL family protein N-acetyltransferase
VPARDTLTTSRLTLRRWRPEDAAAMTAIDSDPAVTRYLNRRVDAAAAAAFAASAAEHWERHGFGFYALELREPPDAGRFVGFAGVAYPAFLPALAHRPELGWRLARDVWGRGLATEAARAARDDAFQRLELAELISIIHPENRRSQRVAAKLGMTRAEHVHNPLLGRDVEVWRLAAPAG